MFCLIMPYHQKIQSKKQTRRKNKMEEKKNKAEVIKTLKEKKIQKPEIKDLRRINI